MLEISKVGIAVRQAKHYVQELYDDAVNITLDGVGLSEDGSVWLITMSFQLPDEGASIQHIGLSQIFDTPVRIERRTLEMDIETNHLIKMHAIRDDD